MGALGPGGALRRSHAAALAALGALLLLLLASHAPAPPPRALPRALRPAPAPASTDALAAHPADAAPPSRLDPRAPAVPPAPQAPHAPPAPPAPPAPAAPPAPPAPPAPRAPVAPPVAPVSSDAPPQRAGAASTRAAARATNGTAAPVARVTRVRDVYEGGHERPHPELCPALGARLRLLVLVTSAPSHAAARDAVRLTWGHYAARRDVALAFVLGAPPAALRPALDAEDALYGDLVVGRSVDSYSNLTLKTLSMLEWADTYCPRAPRLLKTDDDMFINVPRLLRFAAARENATRTIWGKVVRKSQPKRTTKSKYYVSPLQFPGRVFPDFATGPAYLLTADAVRSLLRAAPEERYLRLEDVFVTGVLAAKLGLARSHAPEFYNKKVAPHPCAVQRGIAIHMVQYHEQFDLWRKLLDGKTKCSS